MISKRKLLALTAGLTLAGFTSIASAQEIYIPLISKGFQHQFWQAVKQGAEQAGKDYKVKVTFDGPETEQQVDKQIDMLSAALAKKPAAIGFAALDSKAAIPLLSLPPRLILVLTWQRHRSDHGPNRQQGRRYWRADKIQRSVSRQRP
jgi:ribose transport system substrate-binding protein